MKKVLTLGRLEQRIMAYCWTAGKGTVHEVREFVTRDGYKPAYNTILTMLRKLENKKFLKHSTHSARSLKHVYEPIITRTEFLNIFIKDQIASGMYTDKEMRILQKLVCE